MPRLLELLKSAYETAYDLPRKKQYSEPKLFDFGGDLSKRWYVYYSFRNPDTDKLERQTPIYTGLHQHKNLRDRRAAAKVLLLSISGILKNGLFNPYRETDNFIIEEIQEMSIEQAVTFVLDIKALDAGTGYADFKSRVNQFRDWLHANGYRNRYISKVSRNAIIAYLNHVHKKSSARNRNNTRTAISSFFTVLVDNSIVPANLAADINILKSNPERNKSLTPSQEQEIFEHLDKTLDGRRLSLYLKFVGWGMLRPIEVNRLLVKDVFTQDKTMNVRAKNKVVKIKRIPELLLDELPDLSSLEPDAFLFGRNGYGEPWDANEVSRREYYGDMVRTLIKKPFKLDQDYGTYSMRHTYVAKMFRKLISMNVSYFEAESQLMLITGHTSRKALRMYLRDIDAELPEDYSHLLK